jgi:hypothetical protein
LGFFLTLKKLSFKVKPSVTQLLTTSHVVRWSFLSLQVLQASTEVPIDPENELIYEKDLKIPEEITNGSDPTKDDSSPAYLAVLSATPSRLLKSAIL